MISQYEYVIRQLARTKSKRHEQYIVTGIVHKLGRDDVKFVTQQYVKRASGRALTDLYFPAINLHIEIDEEHHGKQVEQDQLREADIIDATGHEIIRIDVKGTLKVMPELREINDRIDDCVEKIKSKIAAAGTDFESWNMEKELSIEPHILRGYIDVKDNVAFRKITDACNCFGHNYKSLQRASAKHPYHDDILIWLPKIFENDSWNNKISENEDFITEISKSKDIKKIHFDKWMMEKRNKRIVFAKAKDSLGMVLYRFKGLYELDRSKSNLTTGLYWQRISTRVKTHPQKKEYDVK